jgi:hypothetical protein
MRRLVVDPGMIPEAETRHGNDSYAAFLSGLGWFLPC